MSMSIGPPSQATSISSGTSLGPNATCSCLTRQATTSPGRSGNRCRVNTGNRFVESAIEFFVAHVDRQPFRKGP